MSHVVEEAAVKRTLIGMAEAGEPLLRQALEALHQLHEAEDAGVSEPEVERLRLLADSLYQAVNDFQLVNAGQSPSTIH